MGRSSGIDLGHSKYKVNDHQHTGRNKSIPALTITAGFMLSLLVLSGCEAPTSELRYEEIGTVTFRRSFAGHENWTGSELDSAQKSNPTTMTDPGASDSPAFSALQEMGLTAGEELLLDSTGQDLGDTIILHDQGRGADTVLLEHVTGRARTWVRIRNGGVVDQDTVEWINGVSGPLLLEPPISTHPYFALVQYYYIMNGDNYEVSVYRKVDP